MNSLEETPRMLSEERIIEIAERYCLPWRTEKDRFVGAFRAIEAELLSGAGEDAKRLDWLLYEHVDGRHAVAPSAEAATFAHGDPAWHRVGPVAVNPSPRPVRELADKAFMRSVADGQQWEYEGFMSGYEACWQDMGGA